MAELVRTERSLTVAVIGGGQNCEHAVSVASATSVAAALAEVGHDVERLTIGMDGSWWWAGNRLGLAEAISVMAACDVVFPVVHGPRGEDGTLAALCELAAAAYVGSPVVAGALGMDKWATKLAAEALGLRTASGVLMTHKDGPLPPWKGPVVVKPVGAGSSHGVTLVSHPMELGAAIGHAFTLDDRVLVETLVTGREIDIAVLRRDDGELVLSPPLEIVSEGIFDYETKYGGNADFRLPAPLSGDQLAELGDAACRLTEALRCRGVVRVDFFLTEDGWLLNEVNTMPGMTAASQVPRMFAAAGISYPELMDLLVRDAVARV